MEATEHNRVLRLPDVKNRTGLSRSTIYAKVAQQSFPTPIKLSERAVGWLESEVSDWLDQRISERRKEESA